MVMRVLFLWISMFCLGRSRMDAWIGGTRGRAQAVRVYNRNFRFNFPVNWQYTPPRLAKQWPIGFPAFRASGAQGRRQFYYS
jgi:hypothetical protein